MKAFKIKSVAAFAGILLLLAVFQSCQPKPKRAYILSKSDDNNWTTTGAIECDSFTMVSQTEAIFYVDGRRSVLQGKMIKCFSNPYYKP